MTTTCLETAEVTRPRRVVARPRPAPAALGRLLGALLVVAPSAARAAEPRVPPAEWLLNQVKVLSAPDTEGRGSRTPGADRAARHIAAEFQAAGLKPAGPGGTYLQSFSVPTGIRLGPVNRLRLLNPAPHEFALGSDFTPLAVSADGVEEGEAVFAGYGITAPGLGWDDYAGLGPFFGIIPEFGDEAQAGVRISGVRAGSPAETAGVRAGDVLLAFGGVTVKTLEDLTFALRGRRPGEGVEFTILRDGAEQRRRAVLQERR